FDRLVEDLDLPRDLSRSAVFDVLLVLQNNEQSELRFGDVALSVEGAATGISKFDLTFSFSETGEGLLIALTYNTDLFKADRIGRLAEHLQTLLDSVLHDPTTSIKCLDLLPDAEKQQLLHDFNDTCLEVPEDKTLAQLFDLQAYKTPDQIALVFGNKQLTYRELNERSNQLAHHLRAAYAIQPDDIIALQLERSEWMGISILAVLKSGAAYLPIAPDMPQARVLYMLQDARAKALLTDDATLKTAQLFENQVPVVCVETLDISGQLISDPQPINDSRDLAYIIYTSGSTGQPKGVMVEHFSVVNFLTGFKKQVFDLHEGVLRTALTASYTFDGSVRLMLGSLFNGYRLHVVPEAVKLSAEAIQQYLAQHEIDLIDGTPTLLALWLNNGLRQTEEIVLKNILLSGEALPQALLQKFYTNFPQNNIRITNLYGPTETTMVATHRIISSADAALPSTVGKPLPNYEIYILHPELRHLQPIGIAGELCIGGKGLTRGYLNNPELTAEKFVSHLFKTGELMYRT
ncbi:MAG: amino acid adenylation domain-containing protein, partial [Bacteroidota bacterium]